MKIEFVPTEGYFKVIKLYKDYIYACMLQQSITKNYRIGHQSSKRKPIWAYLHPN